CLSRPPLASARLTATGAAMLRWTRCCKSRDGLGSPLFGLAPAISERSFWHPSARAPSIRLCRRLPPLLADQRFFARIVDGVAHAVDVGRGLVMLEHAGQLAVGPQFAGFEQRPH